MLIVCFNKIGKTYASDKYKDKINDLLPDKYESDRSQDNFWPINYIEAIKQSECDYKITLIPYIPDVIMCLNALNIKFSVAVPDESRQQEFSEYWQNYNNIISSSQDRIIIKEGFLLNALSELFDWIELESNTQELVVSQNELNNKITFEQLLNDDVVITDADIREFKATQNKLKMGLILQAKQSLDRILKMSKVLDRLYDELLDRIDNSLSTTDTPSLMYTTEYISKALNDTNQFIMSLVNNDKIQNFFIIDNSSVVNINNDRVSINERERIRKAVEIVIDNLDYFEQGEFNKLKDPNIIDVSEDTNNA